MKRVLRLAMVGGSLLGAGEAAAQDKAEPAFPLTFSGYVTASYTWSSNPLDKTIVGRFYDRNHSEFMANAAKFVVEKPFDPAKVSGGFKLDALFGQNAEVTGYAGNRLGLGDQGDLLQAYAILNVPTGKETYVQFRAGKMATLIGMEVMEDIVNPNLSIGNQFVYLENFTNTGVRMDVKFSPKVDAQFAVFNGWDLVRDNNTGKSVMGRLGLNPSGKTTIGVIGYYGPEQNASGNKRKGAELTLSQKIGSKATLWLEGDYGDEQGLLAGGAKAKWYGVGGWLAVDVSSKASVAFRGDYVDDRNGVRSSGLFGFPANTGLKFGSATATLNIKAIPSILLRPEIRADFASDPVFDTSKSQVTLAFGSSYIF